MFRAASLTAEWFVVPEVALILFAAGSEDMVKKAAVFLTEQIHPPKVEYPPVIIFKFRSLFNSQNFNLEKNSENRKKYEMKKKRGK